MPVAILSHKHQTGKPGPDLGKAYVAHYHLYGVSALQGLRLVRFFIRQSLLWQQGPERLTFKVGVTYCLSSACDLCEVEPLSFRKLVRYDFYEVSL